MGLEDVVRSLGPEIVRAGREAYSRGLVVGSSGNISALDPSGDYVVITPSGGNLGKLQVEDLVVVDRKGRKLWGRGKPSIETPMHLAIYEVREDVRAIVHTHAPIATGFSVAGVEVLPVNVESRIYIPRGVPIVPFKPPGTRELAEAVRSRIAEYDAVILENHGVVAVGRTVEEALHLNLIVEECAKVQLVARLLGRVVTREELEEKFGGWEG